jgi:hypothetical protein
VERGTQKGRGEKEVYFDEDDIVLELLRLLLGLLSLGALGLLGLLAQHALHLKGMSR